MRVWAPPGPPAQPCAAVKMLAEALTLGREDRGAQGCGSDDALVPSTTKLPAPPLSAARTSMKDAQPLSSFPPSGPKRYRRIPAHTTPSPCAPVHTQGHPRPLVPGLRGFCLCPPLCLPRPSCVSGETHLFFQEACPGCLEDTTLVCISMTPTSLPSAPLSLVQAALCAQPCVSGGGAHPSLLGCTGGGRACGHHAPPSPSVVGAQAGEDSAQSRGCRSRLQQL